jgi:DNA-directed RNA polymerase specialized sigma24 family protein
MPDAHAGQDWRAWFAEQGARLLLIARQWTSGKADADELFKETFVRFWKHHRHLSGFPLAPAPSPAEEEVRP